MKRMAALLAALMIFLAGCGRSESTAQPGQELPTGVYTFEEQAMEGAVTILWTLELKKDGSYILTEENPFMGAMEHQGSFTMEGDIVVTGPFEGPAPMAAFFEEDKSCRWTLEGETCTPVNYVQEGTAPQEGAVPQKQQDQAVEILPSWEGVAYGELSPSQVCDIYLPQSEEVVPVIVLVHGGGFAFGDQKMELIRPVIAAALERGYGVVSVDYRKSSEAVFPAALADVKEAVRFVRMYAQEYGFDPDHIALWGESAGAYLSLMTALTPEVETLNGDMTGNLQVSTQVNALVSFYAPVEFYTMYEEKGIPEEAAQSFESRFLGQDIMADEDLTNTTYWETYKDKLPSTLSVWIQAGDADSRVPCTQSENFAQRLAEYLGQDQVSFELLPGADHEDAAFYAPENLQKIFQWLEPVMKE